MKYLLLVLLLLTGCVTSPEEAQPQPNPFDLWQQGNSCVHMYYQRQEYTLADSGSTCPDGTLAEPVGHTRKLVADNCGESLQLVNYHVIYGCVGSHRSKPDTITEEAI